jgi:hypothetical protein
MCPTPQRLACSEKLMVAQAFRESYLVFIKETGRILTNIIEQGYSAFCIPVPPNAISLQLVPLKLLVYNSSYGRSIMYI